MRTQIKIKNIQISLACFANAVKIKLLAKCAFKLLLLLLLSLCRYIGNLPAHNYFTNTFFELSILFFFRFWKSNAALGSRAAVPCAGRPLRPTRNWQLPCRPNTQPALGEPEVRSSSDSHGVSSHKKQQSVQCHKKWWQNPRRERLAGSWRSWELEPSKSANTVA